MFENIVNSHIAVIGGGKRCKALLEAIFSQESDDHGPEVIGVADPDDQAVGMIYAREKGVYTTGDFRDLFSFEALNLLIELTPDDRLREIIQASKPPWVMLVDHHDARSLLDSFQIKAKKLEIQKKLRARAGDDPFTEALLEEFHDFVSDINLAANRHSRQIRQELSDSEWTMSQIVQGSTIPTFVIDKNHRVTHWNRACEKLTGFQAEKMVGTDNQWMPFRNEKRPTMADFILDNANEEDLWRYYGTGWEKSGLIEGAYEAEEFFAHLGPNGTWLYFTAAPIKAPDGAMVGAIETLWDKTREKNAEQARERQNKELADKVKALIANERVMSQIIHGSTIPTFVIDKDHRVTHWNKALENLTGCPADQIVGTRRQWLPFYQEERPSMADVILDQVDESEIRRLYGSKWRNSVLIDGAYEAEVFFPNLGDGGKWCWFTAAPIRTPEGEMIGAIETIWDKTEDRKAEADRQRHTEELATLCSVYANLSGPLSLQDRIQAAIQEVALIFAADGICIFLRRADGRYQLQYSYGFSDLMCFNNRIAESQSLVMRTAHAGKMAIFDQLPEGADQEATLLKQEGYNSLVYIPIIDRQKNSIGVIRIASKRAHQFSTNAIHSLELIGNRIGVAIENSLLQGEVTRKAQFQAKLIGSSNDGIVATDENWNVVILNPAAEKMLGITEDDAVEHLNARSIFPTEIVALLDRAASDASLQGNLPWQELSITNKAGEKIPVNFSGTVLREKRKMMGTVVFLHDLREIKRLEKELVSAERLGAIGQTVAGMAHCIKNILHGLKGGSYLVNVGIEKDKPDKLHNGWQMVQRNIARTSGLVQDLLSYSKEREPEIQQCEPNDIADEVCELMEAAAAENNVEIVKKFDLGIGSLWVDPRSLHRGLLNLVSNAIDACRFDDSIGKKHCVQVTTAMENGGVFKVAVTDNGMGMSEEVQSKLFGSFFSTKGAQGTGLGLLVTRKLIEEHNGTIEVESSPGEGTTFYVCLPAASPPGEDA